MSVALFSSELSVPCRVVRMVARHINLPVTIKDVDGPDRDRFKEELLKMNPPHAVPVLVDGSFTLFESHAIITYLVDKYASGSPLYPEDIETRAEVMSYLMFDVGTLSRRMINYFYPILVHKAEPTSDAETPMKDALQVLGYFLCHKRYLVGDQVTLADIAVAGTLSFSDAADYSLSAYPRVQHYYHSLKKELPYFVEENSKATEIFRQTAR
ncbi:glutathione S-transferase 1-like [Ixodes scapularis]|uniref:glutathione S-transferase 1-like n=1 Tax=Ixodes scapularis TaxID=6945 RepID=UPI001C394433|nr:glutathione S-transferase 1-like [Ixodes scapularis]